LAASPFAAVPVGFADRAIVIAKRKVAANQRERRESYFWLLIRVYSRNSRLISFLLAEICGNVSLAEF
jgi:hypothetical protein